MQNKLALSPEIRVAQATLPEELVLGVKGYAGCPGDGCNDDTGGCTHDASCGQDCLVLADRLRGRLGYPRSASSFSNQSRQSF